MLAELGFNRMSVGVQDFDTEVQRAVNRIQSEAETRAVIDAARANGFRSVNVDLIYGLPQTDGRRICGDARKGASPRRPGPHGALQLRPRAAPVQAAAAASAKPSCRRRSEDSQILALAIDKLTDAGYVYIGMDHFAKPDDELPLAQRAGKLHRNFQGYSTHADCDLLAFGISAIGKVGPDLQPERASTLDDYYDRLDANALPCYRGMEARPPTMCCDAT